jgi:DNA-3-methyladenine glycosylase
MGSKNRILPRSFYSRCALEVAPDLLGKILCHKEKGVLTSGRIVEVEAYLGAQDAASHAYRGATDRNRAMYGPPGRAYVYFTYGNHFCMNVVTDREGVASAVLIRAVEPLEGIEAMKRRRRGRSATELASGPGKLTAALAIGRAAYGLDLTGEPLWICDDGAVPPAFIRTPRIGIRAAADLPYRFLVAGSPFVSRRT